MQNCIYLYAVYKKKQTKLKPSDKYHLLLVTVLKESLDDDTVENPEFLSDDDWGCLIFFSGNWLDDTYISGALLV